MRFEYRCVDTLPRLAWCASLRQGDDVVQGASTKPPSENGPSHAASKNLSGPGSGGCLSNDGVLFASPTNILSRIYSVREGNRLLVSNSLVFLLAQTDDALDLTHPHYYFDFLRHKRSGLTRPTATIRTARRNGLFLHHYTNLLVRSDLSLRGQSKTLSPAPTDYVSYRRMLQSGMERVFSNAADSSRKQRYRPLATLSQGYDSPAVAALAAEPGCTHTLTCIEPPRPRGDQEDGALLAPYLGLRVSSYDRVGFRSLPGIPEAEFCAGMAFGSYVPLSAVATSLERTILLTGHPGDDIWPVNNRAVLPHLLAPGDRLVEGVSSLAEYRLRVGFLWLPGAGTGAHHKEAIHRISRSPEMRRWSVPGSYNRPIARRIVEESGVPRDLFGQSKMATFDCWIRRADAMSVAGQNDFQTFCDAHFRSRRRGSA